MQAPPFQFGNGNFFVPPFPFPGARTIEPVLPGVPSGRGGSGRERRNPLREFYYRIPLIELQRIVTNLAQLMEEQETAFMATREKFTLARAVLQDREGWAEF